MIKRRLVLIVHNIRSCHNVGSLLRTADGLGVEKVYLTGYTPYPSMPGDKRLPHLAAKIDHQISKTALGAEKTVAWKHHEEQSVLIDQLKKDAFIVAALEQTSQSLPLPDFKSDKNIALIVGSEIGGLDIATLKAADTHLEIPMLGQKESFNVASAAAMALYHFKYASEGVDNNRP